MKGYFSRRPTYQVKALLLLGVYVLHFAFFQFLVSVSFDAHAFSFGSFFSQRQHSRSSNTAIAVFRTIEKHQAAKKTIPVVKNLAEFATPAIVISRCFDPGYTHPSQPSPHRLSDASYRYYLRLGVFLI